MKNNILMGINGVAFMNLLQEHYHVFARGSALVNAFLALGYLVMHEDRFEDFDQHTSAAADALINTLDDLIVEATEMSRQIKKLCKPIKGH